MSHAVAVRPIYCEEDLQDALKRLDEIFDAELGTPEGDESEILTILIQAYEREHYPLGPSEPIEAILFHLDRLGRDRSALIPYLGAEATVDAVLARQEPLTVEMIRRLHEGLGIPAESLIGA